jgi:membrane dipeptidase
MPAGRFLVDAHEDIACHCLEYGRDLCHPGEPGGGPPSADGSPGVARVPCMLTLPGLQAAGVRLICATLFTPHTYEMTGGGKVPESERRWKINAQWQMYQDWLAQYPGELKSIRSKRDLAELGTAEGNPIGVILLMEGLELLATGAELHTWFDRGVRLAGITWNGKSHFASGCFSDERGLSGHGQKLLHEFEHTGMILDLAHLNDAGIADALAHYDGHVCSTHSNARAVCPHQRNLTDEQARAIAQRGGVMGLNLLAHFIQPGWSNGDPEPPLEMALRHVEYLADLVGPGHVGLGSDLDGGLRPDNTPLGIDSAHDLPKLGAGLLTRGWTDAQVRGFEGANWWGFFERSLPA